MPRSAVTVSLVPQAEGGPFVFWDGLEAAAAAAARHGFDALEVFAPSAESVDRGALRSLLARHRLAIAAFGTGAGWVLHRLHLAHPDREARHRAREFIRAFVDLGAEFGAPAIVGSMQGRAEPGVGRDQALGWLGEALADLGAHARRRGTLLLYEPLNRGETNLINRQAEAAAFLEKGGLDGVALLCDLYHMALEEPDSAAALRACGRHVGHVHFADDNRRAVGFGSSRITPIADALREIGYAGYLSAEVLPLPDSVSAADQSIRSIRSHFPASPPA